MAARKKHTPEQVVRKLATAGRSPRRDKYTTWTAVAPDLVSIVLTYGPSPLYGPPLVRNFSSPDQQTSRSLRRAIGTPESCPKSGLNNRESCPVDRVARSANGGRQPRPAPYAA
jgi:hypothetical protein